MTMAVVGALALSPLADGASASTGVRQASSSPKLAVTQLVPPSGMVWVQGVLTDQAGHGLDNVNVEVWPSDPAATAPIGSNLTYGGFPQDGRHGHGAYRVEVPARSALPDRVLRRGRRGGRRRLPAESYGQGRPIMFRSSGAKAAGCQGRHDPQPGDDRARPPGQGPFDDEGRATGPGQGRQEAEP